MDRYLIPHKRLWTDPITDAPNAVESDDDLDVNMAATSSVGPELREVSTNTIQIAEIGENIPPGPQDISQLPDGGPVHPELKKYPIHEDSGQSRSFNRSWFGQYDWLEYSITQDAAYCFACRHFLHVHFGRAERSFSHNGFTNWKKATSTLKSHDNSSNHKLAMQAWSECKVQKITGSRIRHAFDASDAKTVKENKTYIKAVIYALLYTACRNIAQRGHKEDSESVNRGNFLEFLTVIANYDEIVKKKLNDPANAKYTHHDIQNELFEIMAGMIRKEISEEVKYSEHFALLVDETKNISKTEQLSVAVRYLHGQNLLEEFLGFTAAEGLDADSLLLKIKQTLAKCGIDQNACIGQCYDGASVMSGRNNGVQELFRINVKQAVYIHCYAHRLNLVLVDCIHNVKSASEFCLAMQRLYNFFSTSERPTSN